MESLEYPTQLKKFIQKCGAEPNAYTKEVKKMVKAVLQSLSKLKDTQERTSSAEDSQGTGYLLRNHQLSNTDNFKMTEGSDDMCRKDIGIIHRLHTWSRGIVEIVSGGGIIEYWAPIFESEGLVQTFFIMLMFLLLKLKGLDKDDYQKFYISYDDMPSIGVTTSSPK